MTSKVEVKTNINLAPWKRLRDGLQKPMGVKVGILGTTDARPDGSPLGNAGIGAIQEFGSVTNNIPPRSFLRMPLETKQDTIEDAIASGSVKKNILEGNIKAAFTGIGIIAEGIIQDAFSSRGFGKWAPNKPSTIARKGSDKPLIDIGELRKSVTSKVVEKK